MRTRKKAKPISKATSIKSVIKCLKFCEEILNFDATTVDVIDLWTKITGNSLHINCEECGKPFQNRNFDSNWNLHMPSCTNFCSDKCCSEHRTKMLSLLPKRVLSAERKQQISINSKRAHARNPEMGKNVSKKALDTMRKKGNLSARRDKALQTKLERGVIAEIRFDKGSKEHIEYRKYYRKVWSITRSQDLNSLENFEKRGKKTWHLDHIFPISIAYVLGIPANLIGDIQNLVMLEANKNRKKSNKIFDIPLNVFEYIVDSNKLEELEEIC